MSERIIHPTGINEEHDHPWWQGGGKEWKQTVIGLFGNVSSGKEFLEQHPYLSADDLVGIKERLQTGREISGTDGAVNVIIGALGQLMISQLPPREKNDHALGTNFLQQGRLSIEE